MHQSLKIVIKSGGKKGLFQAAADTLPNQYRFWDKNSRIEAIFDSIHGKRGGDRGHVQSEGNEPREDRVLERESIRPAQLNRLYRMC